MSLIDLLAGGESAPSAFNRDTPPGTRVGGKVVSASERQMRDYEKGDPAFWDDGSPKKQAVIIVETQQSTGPDDDGRRGFYIKWWGKQRQSLLDAVAASGAKDIVPGGTFYGTYIGEGANDNPRLNPPKIYRYEYTPPAAKGLTVAPGGDSDPWNVGPPPAPVSNQAPAADPPVNLANLDPNVLAALKAAGAQIPGT